MHKMCQILNPHRRLRPLSPLLDLATLTIAFKRPEPVIIGLIIIIIIIIYEFLYCHRS